MIFEEDVSGQVLAKDWVCYLTNCELERVALGLVEDPEDVGVAVLFCVGSLVGANGAQF